jgi:hypothetical protein
MINWVESMQQTFEYYIVDPATWKDTKQITNVTKCSVSRDLGADTLGSATIDITESIGECYIRIYLVAIQNGYKEKFPLGTFMVQTPSTSFNGKLMNVSMDAYTPLLELKEKLPPLGFSVAKGQNIMDMVYNLASENARAPIVKATCDKTVYSDFVANTEDTWLTFLIDLAANANYEFMLDEIGRVLFAPKQDTASLQPVWTYSDDNSSILQPELDLDHDMYGVPNAVEIIYSNGSNYFHTKIVNDDPNSPISTVNRGREILHRETDPSISGNPTKEELDQYAERLLSNLSTLEYSVSYTHGYCPVRVGDCVRLNYERAGLTNVKAKVISQSISCASGCQVEERAVFTNKLWR